MYIVGIDNQVAVDAETIEEAIEEARQKYLEYLTSPQTHLADDEIEKGFFYDGGITWQVEEED